MINWKLQSNGHRLTPDRLTFLVLIFAIIFTVLAQAVADTHYVMMTNPSASPPYTNWLTAATNIQSALWATSDGDTVLVTNGTYTGSMNRGLLITNYTIVSSVNGPEVTIIDCETNNYGFKVNRDWRSTNTTSAVVSGFTIKRGWGYAIVRGGGIFCETRTTIENCNFVSNEAYQAGGIWLDEHSGGSIVRGCTISYCTGRGFECVATNALIEDCVISNNTTVYDPSGIYFSGVTCATMRYCRVVDNYGGTSGGVGVGNGASPCMEHCIIAGNKATTSGGAIQCFGSGAIKVFNCTVVSNSAPSGSGIKSDGGGYIQVTNSIFWNSGTEFAGNLGGLFVQYSCIHGGYSGTGNIMSDPLLLSSFELSSNSPCIDAGTAISNVAPYDIVHAARPLDGNGNGTAEWDMGAYEYINPLADSDRDGMKDADEIIAGTSPTSFLDSLRVASAGYSSGGGECSFSLNSVAGRWYSLQERTNLIDGDWQDVPGNTNVPGDGSLLSFTNATLFPQNFYRVRVQSGP